jgi:hypothetical protein
MNEPEHMEQLSMIPADPQHTSLFISDAAIDPAYESNNVFRKDIDNPEQRELIRKHRAWLDSFRHEYPQAYRHYRIGVYIRYHNQTKYENYLDYHKKQFADTISECENWKLVDFYIDEGISAPNMESAKEWCRLLNDCFAGKINLIVTQKVSNVSRKATDIAFISRLLAAQKEPVGIYFISEDIFTLASYYQSDLHETAFLPKGWLPLPDDEFDQPQLLTGGEQNDATDE